MSKRKAKGTAVVTPGWLADTAISPADYAVAVVDALNPMTAPSSHNAPRPTLPARAERTKSAGSLRRPIGRSDR